MRHIYGVVMVLLVWWGHRRIAPKNLGLLASRTYCQNRHSLRYFDAVVAFAMCALC